MTMIKANAVVALFGASLAQKTTRECPESTNELPEDFQSLHWKLQAAAKFAYMDQCDQNGSISYMEYSQYNEAENEGQNRAEFLQMDTDGDRAITLEEMMRQWQVKQESMAPLGRDAFDFLVCRPALDGDVCDTSYTKTDLRAVLRLLQEDPKLDVYDYYVERDFQLRDYNRDGRVSLSEHEQHDIDKQVQLDLFNSVILACDTDDDGLISGYDELICSDFQPLLNIYLSTQYDYNHDGKLAFYEIWRVNQTANIINKFNESISEIAQEAAAKAQQERLESEEAKRLRQLAEAQAEELRYEARKAELKAREAAKDAERRRFEAEEAERLSLDAEAQAEKERLQAEEAERLAIEAVAEAELKRLEAEEAEILRQEADKYSKLYHEAIADMEQIDTDLNNILTIEEITAAGYKESIIMEVYDLLGKAYGIDDIHVDEMYTEVILYEHQQYEILQTAWQEGFNTGEAKYAVTLADIDSSDPLVLLALQVSDQAQVEALFAEIDQNGDGYVDGDEACRHYISDTDFSCQKFDKTQYEWFNLIYHWNENPLGN